MKFAISVRPGQVFVEPDLLPVCGVFQAKAWHFDGQILKLRLVQKPHKRPGASGLRPERTKIEWPSVEQLQADIKEIGYAALSRRLGVSDYAIRNRIRTYGKPVTQSQDT